MFSLTVKTFDAFKFDGVAESDNTGSFFLWKLSSTRDTSFLIPFGNILCIKVFERREVRYRESDDFCYKQVSRLYDVSFPAIMIKDKPARTGVCVCFLLMYSVL